MQNGSQRCRGSRSKTRGHEYGQEPREGADQQAEGRMVLAPAELENKVSARGAGGPEG